MLANPSSGRRPFVPIPNCCIWRRLTNPTLDLIDLQFVGDICKANDIIYVVDNCFATPYLQRPAEFGADIVIHSATKWIDGQGRVLGGVIAGKKALVDTCYGFIRRTGPSMSPFNAWYRARV